MKTVTLLALTAAVTSSTVLANAVDGHGPNYGHVPVPHKIKRHFGGRRGIDHAKRTGSAVLLATQQSAAENTTTTTTTSEVTAKASKEYKSLGVWSTFNGQESACGTYNNDTQLIFGISQEFWTITYTSYAPNKTVCGVPVDVTNTETGKTIAATVLENSGQKDYTLLSQALFTGLGGVLEDGIIPISFVFPQGFNNADGTPPIGGNLTTVGTAADLEASSSDVSSAVTTETSSATVSSSAVPTTITSSPKATSTADEASAASQSSKAAHAQALLASESSSETAAAEASSSRAEAAASSSSRAAAAARSSSEAAASASSEAAASASRASVAAAQESSKAAAAASSSSSAAAAASQRARVAAQVEASTSSNSDSDSGSSGSSQIFSGGLATFYFQNGVAGNCGTVASDSQDVIALPTAMYANGAHCGDKIKITRVSNGAVAYGVVRDSCPTCVNNNCLDLSTGLYDQLGSRVEGQFDIKWQFV